MLDQVHCLLYSSSHITGVQHSLALGMVHLLSNYLACLLQLAPC